MEPASIGFVYVWYDRLRCKLYVGSHWGDPLDGYVCSSAYMKRAYRHRPQHFMRRIVYRTTNREKLLEMEYRWLKLIPDDQLGKRFYNLHNGKPGHWSVHEHKRITVGQKISMAPGRGQKISEALNRFHETHQVPSPTVETLQKRGASIRAAYQRKPWKKMHGREHTEAAKQKMRTRALGNRNAAGHVCTPEARAKQSAAAIRRYHPAF